MWSAAGGRLLLWSTKFCAARHLALCLQSVEFQLRCRQYCSWSSASLIEAYNMEYNMETIAGYCMSIMRHNQNKTTLSMQRSLKQECRQSPPVTPTLPDSPQVVGVETAVQDMCTGFAVAINLAARMPLHPSVCGHVTAMPTGKLSI